MRIHHLRSTLLVLVGAALAAGCKREAPTAARQGGWSVLAHATGLTVYLDTARIERFGDGRAKIWLRFAYLQPFTPPNDTTVHYEAAETRQELNCVNRTTRGLELRMQPVGGVAVAQPVPDSVSQSIDTHPLNSGVFLVACKTIGHPIPPKAGS